MSWALVATLNVALGAVLMVLFDRGCVIKWCLRGWKWPRMALAAGLWPISLWFAIRE